jgi:hypothetical protein
MKEHNSNEISLGIAGFPIIDGRGEIGGAFVKHTPRGPAFGDFASQDGEVSRFKTNERRYDISVFLPSTSAANAFMSALYNSDLNIPGGAGVGTYQYLDRNSAGTAYFAEHCWITQMPEHEGGEKPVLLEWKLTAVMTVAFIAGN